MRLLGEEVMFGSKSSPGEGLSSPEAPRGLITLSYVCLTSGLGSLLSEGFPC